jgi:hypothetical protein
MSSYTQLVTIKLYDFLQNCYLIGRIGYDKVFPGKPADHSIKTRKISLIELNSSSKQVSKHDITVSIKDQYTSNDIHEFSQKSKVPAINPENGSDYFVEFEYNSAGNTYKYLTELPPQSTEVVFPVYTKESLEQFHKDCVPNGVMLSSINDEHDITDELNKHAGPKGNFYSDLKDYSGFKLEWVKVFDTVPPNLETTDLTVEVFTYHGKTYVFSNTGCIRL